MLTAPSIAAVLGINVIFAGAYIVGKIGVSHFPPLFFAAFRFVFVLLVLAPFLRFNNNIKQNWRAVLAFCLLMGVGVYSTMYWALYAAGGASAILIGTQLSTPFAVLLGAWLLGERASWVVWGGITLTMIGVLIVGFDTAVLGYPLAFALVLLSAIFYASANVVLRGLRNSGVGLLNLNAWMVILAAPPLFLMSWLAGEPWLEPLAAANRVAWGTLLYSSLAVSLAGHLGMFALLRRHTMADIMPFYVFTPIFGVFGAILFLDETPTLRFAIGAVLAIIGIFIINTVSRRSARID